MPTENLFDVQKRGDGVVVQRPDKLTGGGLTREEALNLAAHLTHHCDPTFETLPDMLDELSGKQPSGAPPKEDASPSEGRTGAPDF